MYAGRFASSRSHLEQVLTIYDPISHRSLVHQAGIHPHVHALAALGFVLLCLGYPDQALLRSNEALGLAQGLAQPSTMALSLEIGARVFSLVGDITISDAWTDKLIAVADEQGFPFWRALGTIFRGWINVKNGDVLGRNFRPAARFERLPQYPNGRVGAPSHVPSRQGM